MTLSELRQLVSDFLSNDLDNYRGETPNDDDLTKQINWAYRVLARKCILTIDASLTLEEGVSIYDYRDTSIVSDKIIKPYYLYIDRHPLLQADGFAAGFWTYQELINDFPSWKTSGSGTPCRVVPFSFNKIILHPAPSASIVALASGYNSIFGTYLPAALRDLGEGEDSTADIPQLPEEIHEAIAYLAAQVAATPTVSEQEGWMRLQKFSDYWTGIIQDVADQNERTLSSLGSTTGYRGEDLIQI